MTRWMVPPLLLVLLVGCATPRERVPAIVPTFAAPSTTAAAPTTAESPTLPTDCGQVVPGPQLDAVLGVPVAEMVDVVVGEPIPDIGRTARTTCRYGTAASGTFPLEVSLTSYGTTEQAQDRVRVTVNAAARDGVAAAPVMTGGTDGVFLPYPAGGIVVASAGTYSVAVTAAPGLLPPELVAPRAAAVVGVVLAGMGV